MLYHVTRNGQNYGPYTIEDLKRYVASGNILPSDMAKSDDMADWVPVAHVLGQTVGGAPGAPIPYPPASAQPYAPLGLAPYPDAPNLNWGLVLLFAFFTCSLFMFVWNLVNAAWLKRVQPNSKAIIYYAIATVLFFLQMALGTHAQTHIVTQPPGMNWNWMLTHYQGHPWTGLLGLATWIIRLIARFTMRSELEQHFNTAEPVGLSLSGVMTFFFGGVYFQYHLNRINELKRMARYRGAQV